MMVTQLIWTDAGNLESSSTLLNNETITFGNGTDVIYGWTHANHRLFLPNDSFNLLSSGDSLNNLTIGQNYFIQGSWSHSTFNDQKNNYLAGDYSGSFTTGESTNQNEDYSYLVLYNAQATDFFSPDNTNFLVLKFDYSGFYHTAVHPTDMAAGVDGNGNAIGSSLRNQKVLINGPSGNAGDESASLSLSPGTRSVHTYSSSGTLGSGQSTRWRIAGGEDASLFTINSWSGELQFAQEDDVPTTGNNTDTNSDGIYKVDIEGKATSEPRPKGRKNFWSVETWQSLTLTVDTVRPTIAVSSDVSSLKAGETTALTFTLSESSTDFTASDISVSGGTLSGFSGSGTSYSATFTPDTDSTSDGVISVASGAFSDAWSNNNLDGSEDNNSVTLSVDTEAPTSTVSIDSIATDSGSSSTDFITSDSDGLTINATLSAALVSGEILQYSNDNGSSWTTVSNTDISSTSVSFSDNALTSSNTIQFRVTDAAGNSGAAASQAIVIDTSAPTTTVSIDSIATDSGSSSTDFITTDSDGLTINATLSAALVSGEILQYSNDNGSSWSTVSNTDISSTSVSFSDNALTSSNTIQFRVTDAAGNSGAAASQAIVIDTSAPTTTVSIDSIATDSGSSSTDFITTDSDGLTINATLSAALVSGEILQYSNDNGSSWSTVSNTDISSTSVSFTDNALTSSNTIQFRVTDAAGNSGAAASQAIVIDTAAPTIALRSDTNTLRAGETASVTFTLSEASTDFAESDITLSGGSLANWTAVSRTFYTATFIPIDNSTTNGVVSVASTKFSDSAGNSNDDGSEANNSVTFSVNTINPSPPTSPSPPPALFPAPSPPKSPSAPPALSPSSSITSFESSDSPLATPTPGTTANKSDIYLLLDTSTSMLQDGGIDGRKFQSMLALESFTQEIERAGYQFQHRDTKTTLTSAQLLQTLYDQTTTQAGLELNNYVIIDNPNDAKNADNINLHLITYDYHVQHKTLSLYRTNPNSGIGMMQAILNLKMAGEEFENSLKNNSKWQELGLPEPNHFDLFQGDPERPSNLYSGTELLGALEGLDYLLNNKANDPNRRDQSTTICLVLDGRPERRSWWDTRTNSASDSVTGLAIPLPESLGKEDITTSGLLYDELGNPYFFQNNQRQWQWIEMQNDLNTALNQLAHHSKNPAEGIQVKAYGLNTTGRSSLTTTYQDLFFNRIFDNSLSSWSYSHQTIQFPQDPSF